MVQLSYNGGRERWLLRRKSNMKKLKKTLAPYYIMRTNIQEILIGWDTKED